METLQPLLLEFTVFAVNVVASLFAYHLWILIYVSDMRIHAYARIRERIYELSLFYVPCSVAFAVEPRLAIH